MICKISCLPGVSAPPRKSVAGRYLMQSNHQEWAAYLAINVTSEHEVAVANRNNIEGLVGTQYAFFHYDSPERSLAAELGVLPSFTEAGRVRAGAKVRLRFE